VYSNSIKGERKGGTHDAFDDESAFFSHTPGLTRSHFVSLPQDVYSQGDKFDVYSDAKEDDLQHHAVVLSSMYDDCYDNVDQNYCVYSFLRFASCDSHDDTYIECETLDFSIMSNIIDVYIDVSSIYHLQSENSVESTALVSHVLYDNADDSTNWIIACGSTQQMKGFASEFLNMTLEGYGDILLVKGLVSGTKAYGIGSCIVVAKDSVGMFHQIWLEDVLYVPNLLHHHPRFLCVI
jgi:hypothetical protein